MAITIG
ncbi:hypothetical protein D044_2615A, partial [Vibrio parahaemolyticus EKP-026]